MGQCYSVNIDLRYKDKANIEETLKRFIKSYNADYRLEKLKLSGITVDTLEGLLKITICENLKISSITENEISAYADFDASYGWETQMQEMFKAIALYLEKGSCIRIWPDNGVYELRITEGGMITNDLPDPEEVMETIKRDIYENGKDTVSYDLPGGNELMVEVITYKNNNDLKVNVELRRGYIDGYKSLENVECIYEDEDEIRSAVEYVLNCA